MFSNIRSNALPRVLAVGLSCALILPGCGGDNLPREAVSGSVSVDGKPLRAGLITFVPAAPDIPTQASASVVEGKYSIARAQGLVPGKYKVVISSGEGTPEKQVDTTNNDMPGMPPIPAKDAVPPQYNSGSILEANVAAGSPNQFEFSLSFGPGGK